MSKALLKPYLPTQEQSVKNTFKIGELFSGPGGMALGAEKAQYKSYKMSHIWACDYHKDSCETFRKNIKIENSKVRCADISTLEFDDFNPIDGLFFGFPCNDFSVVGEQKGIQGKYGSLYMHSVRALEHFQPQFFIAENVGGLLSADNKDTFERICCAIQECGYNIHTNLYKFEYYGVPQRRHRIIIVGFRDDIKIDFKHPQPNETKIITCKEALESPPLQPNALNHDFTTQSKQVIERLKHIKPGQNAFNATLPEKLKLNLKSKAAISQIYKRLDPSKPAYTVTGSGGGGTHVYHWQEPRALTNRERARLQTFPDNFEFIGGKESVRRQIGMAVPPKGVEVICRAILTALQKYGIAPC